MIEELFFDLPPLQRATRYRELAEYMLARAQGAKAGEARVGFITMATGWLEMAEKLEAEYGKISAPADGSKLPSSLEPDPS